MWIQGNYGNEIRVTKREATRAYHQGDCEQDVRLLAAIPHIKRQLDKLDPEKLKLELSEYGAWDDIELSDHDMNIIRWLWIGCGDIYDNLPASFTDY